MIRFRIFSVFFLACAAYSALAQDPAPATDEVVTTEEDAVDDFAGNREPAAKKSKPKAKSKSTVRSGAPKKSGADAQEGWIIRRDENGRLVKVPRKQIFQFSGSELEAGANRPSQTVLGQRPVYRKTTLIPERASFRREFYEASGYSASGRSE